MTCVQDESFGPVLTVETFAGDSREAAEDAAVAIANDTIYGLTNYVQTQDGKRRNRLARALKSGMVETNGVGRGRGSAFGGVKASGRAREGGVWGIEEFMDSLPQQVKSQLSDVEPALLAKINGCTMVAASAAMVLGIKPRTAATGGGR